MENWMRDDSENRGGFGVLFLVAAFSLCWILGWTATGVEAAEEPETCQTFVVRLEAYSGHVKQTRGDRRFSPPRFYCPVDMVQLMGPAGLVQCLCSTSFPLYSRPTTPR